MHTSVARPTYWDDQGPDDSPASGLPQTTDLECQTSTMTLIDSWTHKDLPPPGGVKCHLACLIAQWKVHPDSGALRAYCRGEGRPRVLMQRSSRGRNACQRLFE